MTTAPDPYRWVSVRDACTRLPMRREDAEAMLIARGLVHDVAGRRAVWLPDLELLKATTPTQPARPAKPTQPASGLRPMPRLP